LCLGIPFVLCSPRIRGRPSPMERVIFPPNGPRRWFQRCSLPFVGVTFQTRRTRIQAIQLLPSTSCDFLLRGLGVSSYVAVSTCSGRPPLSRVGVSGVCREPSISSHNLCCAQYLPLQRRTGKNVGTRM